MNDNDDVTEQEVEIDRDESELAPDAQRKLKLAQVLPMQLASGDVRRSAAGRPKAIKKDGKVVSKPTREDLEYLARMQEMELRFVDSDDIVRAARSGASAADVLRMTLVKVAQNAASLEFQRIEQQKLGEDTTQLISRSTKVLKEVAVLQTELRDMSQQVLDPRSEPFQRVYKLWVEKIQAVIREVMSPEQADMFFTKFGASMEDWEEQAESVLR